MIHHESLEQRAVIRWADMASMPDGGKVGDYLYAVPNGGARRPAEAAIMKAEGVRAGFPDLGFAYPANGWPGLFLELKRKDGGRLEPKQKAWLERLAQAGYKTAVCHGAEEAIEAIKTYLAE